MQSKTTRFGLFLVLCSLFFFSKTSAQLVTKSVDDGTDGTLRQEILDTPAGGTITFAEGIDTIALTSELLIEKELTISADSTARVIIDAQTQSRIFNITAGPVTLSYLNLVNGNSYPDNVGGGIKDVAVDLNLFDINITNCLSLSGGGVYIQEAENFVVIGGTMQENLGFNEGGAFHIQAENTTFEDVLIDRNGSDDAGAGIFNNGGNLRISGSTISNNTFTSFSGVSIDGAGIYNSGGNLVIENSTLTKNDSRSEGGAIFSTGGNVEITDSEISNNGAKFYGGGMALFGNTLVTLSNVNLSGNSGSGPDNSPVFNDGAGIYASGNAKIVINGGTINNNEAGRNGGGIYLKHGELTINGTEILENSANDARDFEGGGAIYNSGGTLIINAATRFINNIVNSSSSYGGALLIEEGGTLLINNPIGDPVLFQGNYARGFGGAIAYRSSQPLNLNNVVFAENTALYGGAFHNTSSSEINISGGEFSGAGKGDESVIEGGAIWNTNGTLNIEDTSISENNVNERGGGIYNNGGTININNSEIDGNLILDFDIENDSGGGAIYNTGGGNLTISNTLISNNSVSTFGGAIVDNSTGTIGTVSLTNVIFRNNSTDYDEDQIGAGGALYMKGSGFATIVFCEFSNNITGKEGGAIWNDTATINIKTSTISGNYTSSSYNEQQSDGKGGGIYNRAGSIYIDASTLVLNNSENIGGAIYNATSAAITTLKNSIVALNSAVEGNNLAGENGFVSADYNLIGEDSLSVFQSMSNDLEGTVENPLDPMIDSLANNGGFTQTHALLENSPAFNVGNPIDDFPDQRGEAVFAGRRDIGAFEAQTNLGVDDRNVIAQDKSLIYPNPSKGRSVTVNVPDAATAKVNISIYEIGSGRLISSQVGKSGLNSLKTDGLKAGTYIVRLVSDHTTESLKMILDR